VLSEEDLAAGRSFDALPAGALALLPEPAAANGFFTADYTFVGGRHYRGVRVALRGGRIIELNARRDAAELRERLAAAAGDADLIAQVAIGLNPAGSGTTGMPVLDPNLAGTVTLSFGNNELLGGTARATLDLIMPATSLTVRGGKAELVRRGVLAD
jgi:leucyl aminopeptidase (aminopeptidase T)